MSVSLPNEIITEIINDDDVIGSVASAPHDELLANDLQLNNLKADKIIGATNGNIVNMDSFGNIRDDGIKASDFEPEFSKNDAFNKNFSGDGSSDTVARGDHSHLNNAGGMVYDKYHSNTYNNSTGKLKMVSIQFLDSVASGLTASVVTAKVDYGAGLVVVNTAKAINYDGAWEYGATLTFMVPAGSDYRVDYSGSIPNIIYWSEMN